MRLFDGYLIEREDMKIEEAIKSLKIENVSELSMELRKYRSIETTIASFLNIVSDKNNPQTIDAIDKIKDTKMAESIGIGYVYTGKDGKKKNRITIEEFEKLDKGVINSCKLAIEGFDCPGLSVGIVLGVDSSATKAIQSTGRVVRKEGSKYAEMFTLVMENTVEQEWFKKSHPKGDYVTIDVENLLLLLKGEPWNPYKKKLQNYTYRF